MEIRKDKRKTEERYFDRALYGVQLLDACALASSKSACGGGEGGRATDEHTEEE